MTVIRLFTDLPHLVRPTAPPSHSSLLWSQPCPLRPQSVGSLKDQRPSTGQQWQGTRRPSRLSSQTPFSTVNSRLRTMSRQAQCPSPSHSPLYRSGELSHLVTFRFGLACSGSSSLLAVDVLTDDFYFSDTADYTVQFVNVA